ncbi:hypothetical protein OTU49_003413 [Cherax quadricarinatus]|uniref:Fe2OG dioxygenase domain-containing protein n=1 Tax=Cherax quadricarinatus TaxID=27406 RepID=A0AAW0XK56_CHEQU
MPIVKRFVEEGCMPVVPDQLTINRYLPGQGIPPHVDTHSSFTDEILSLSIGGGVNMDFRYIPSNSEGMKNKPCHYVVYLPPRSLCVMTGPARYEWSHGICPRMTDVVPNKNSTTGLQLLPREERVSFTFRKVRHGECWCRIATVCDSYKKSKVTSQEEKSSSASATMLDDRNAAKLEREHVLQVYDQIAEHFSVTRHKPWPQVLEERRLAAVSEMLRVLSIGGRGLIYVWAMEQQKGKKRSTYLKHNKTNSHDTQQDESLIAISKNLNFEEEQNTESNQRSIKASTSGASSLPVHVNRTEFVQQDMLVPWKLKTQKKKEGNCDKKGHYEKECRISYRCRGSKTPVNGPSLDAPQTTVLENDIKENYQNNSYKREPQTSGSDPVFHRFYHVFKQGELEALCSQLNVNIIKSYYDEGNWCIIFEKVS